MPKLERRRYLALRVESEQPFSGSTVMDALVASVQKIFGEYGGSQANLKLIKHIPKKSQLIIRCSHASLEKVRAAAALITEINQKPAAIHVINVSGTLKALSKKT